MIIKLFLSFLTVILTNLAQLLGVLFLNWNFFNIFLIYWLESFIIIFFGFFKARRLEKENEYTAKEKEELWGSVNAVFFSLVYGFLSFMLFPKTMSFISIFWAIFLIFLSHWFSYIFIFCKQEEFKKISVLQFSHFYYKRVLEFVAIFTFCTSYVIAFSYDYYPNKITKGPLIIMVLIKTIVDLVFLIEEHRKIKPVFHH